MKNLYIVIVLIVLGNISAVQAQTCDLTDAICSGSEIPGSKVYYYDDDGDGKGNPDLCGCHIPGQEPDKWVDNSLDCDDDNPDLPTTDFWRDNDEGVGDGYGDPNDKFEFLVCDPPSGWVPNDYDCDPTNKDIYPGAPEICDGLDNNCDGNFDEDTVNPPLESDVSVTSTACGEVTLTHDGPSNWYWQTAEDGISENDNANNKVVTTGDVLWLRAKSGICWSDALEVTFSTDPITINQPGVSGITERCGNGDLTLTPGYVTHEGRTASHFIWYNASGVEIDQTTAGSSETFTLTQATTYYEVAAVVEECEGPTIGVTLTVNYPPQEPTAQEIRGCGTTTVQLVGPPTGPIRWYWQTAADGEVIGDDAGQKTFNDSGTAYVRAYNENTTCWSTTETINYAVNQPPLTPDVTVDVTQNCSSVTLSYTDTSGTGVDWYWQSEEFGTETLAANAATSIDLSSGTEYFLRALSSNGCWSNSSLQINYGITGNFIDPPTVPATDRCDAGDIALYPEYNGLHDPNDNNITYNFYDTTGALISNVPYGGAFTATITATTTYEVRSVNDGCEGPGTNVTATVIVPDTIYFADFDGDGLGDPFTPSEPVCEQPEDYVSDDSDNCPGIHDPTNTCEGVDVNATHNPDNYIYSRSYQVKRDTQLANFFTASDDVIQEISYFDGLGRPRQQIAIDQTFDKNDLVTHIGFDGFNRQAREWLPYEATVGALASYRSSAKNDTDTWYEQEYGDEISDTAPNPFSQKFFEPSPLNRVLKQGAPGEAWLINPSGADNAIEMEYQTNTATEVLRFSVNTNNSAHANTFVPSLQANGTYAVGELTKVVTKDENHTSGTDHTMEEFKDKNGRVVLKRTYNAGVAHDTHYVYDDFGNLSYVLPPLVNAADGVSATEMEALCYQYVYDNRNRLIEKQLPGKGREYIVYNELDQPIMTQDANQRDNDEWLFTKYDAFGRVAYTGKVTDDSDRPDVQTSANGVTGDLWVNRGSYTNGGIDIGYENTAYPTSGITEVLTVNYYDDYNFNRANEPTPPTQVFGENLDDRVKGLATGSKVRVLTTDDWITTVTRYNYQGQVIYTYTENEFLNSVDVMTTDIDFVGRPITVRAAHNRGTTNVVTLDNFTYDHVGRLMTQTQCIGDNTLGNTCPTEGPGTTIDTDLTLSGNIIEDQVATDYIKVIPNATITPTVTLRIDPNANNGNMGGQELIVSNTYNKLGQLASKKVGGDATGNGLQTVDYTYNVRGWLQGINDAAPNDNALTLNGEDLWGFRIKYNDIADPTKQLFNGNISETLWDSKTENPSGNAVSNRYTYTYDALNRITAATDNTGNYNLAGVGYDKNGNITDLQRQGLNGQIDDLTYAYYNGQISNRLQAVADGSGSTEGFADGVTQATEYVYDDNGNMVSDANKGITAITYNHLNLPVIVSINGSEISYIYDATGTKLSKSVGSGGTAMVYAGNFIYDNTELQFFNTPEGYVSPNNSGGYDYIYQFKDHLGNIRLSYSDSDGDGRVDVYSNGTDQDGDGDNQNEIIEESNYYPFGLKHKGYNQGGDTALGNDVAQKWQYNGIEFEENLGLNLYEMDLRQYDPALARWIAIDPVTHHSMSTYTAFDNNPVFWSDPSGANSAVYSRSGITFQGFEGSAQFYDEDEEEEDCPDCDDVYVLVNTIHSAAIKFGNDFAQSIIEGDLTEYERLLEKDHFELNEPVHLGEGLPEAERNDEKYRFTLDNIPILDEGEVKMLKTWINDIYLQTDRSKNNIDRIERAANYENVLGGNRYEGNIRFRNSDGQHIANLFISEKKDATNFWRTHFINIRNAAFMSSLMAHDRTNGTELAKKYKNTTFGIIK